MSEEEIAALVDSMCLTWRHDFGLDQVESDLAIPMGVTEIERRYLRGQMRQLVEHHFLPLLAQANAPRSGVKYNRSRGMSETWRTMLTKEEQQSVESLDKAIQSLASQATALRHQRRTIFNRAFQRNNRKGKQKVVDTNMEGV